MKTLLNVLIIISFSIPIAFFSWIVWDWPTNYFYDMFDAMRHWTTGEMGYWHIYPILFGSALLIVKKLYNKKLSAA
jgi:hypothetical protein